MARRPSPRYTASYDMQQRGDHSDVRPFAGRARKRHMVPGVLVFLLALVSFVLPIQHVYAAPQLELTQTASVTQVSTGVIYSYKFQYRCASTTENCLNVVVTDILPPQLSSNVDDVTLLTNDDIQSINYDPGTRTATWTFDPVLDAGSTGEITMLVMVRDDGTITDNTIVSNSATMTAGNASTVTSNSVNVTARAQNTAYFATKTRTGGSFLIQDEGGNPVDAEVTYQVQACQPNDSNQGGLNLSNITMVDTLPAGAVFVSASDAHSYDPGTGTVTWNLPDLPVGPGSQCHSRTITVRYPAGTFTVGDNVTNEVDVSATRAGGVNVTFNNTHTGTLVGPLPGGSFSKDVAPGFMNRGGSVTFSLNVANTGNVPLRNFTVTDVVPAQVNVTRINAEVVGGQAVTVEYQTSSSAVWTSAGTFATDGNYSVDVASLGLGPGVYITQLRWSYGDVPVDFASSGAGFVATILSTDHNGQPVDIDDIIQNNATLSADNLASSVSDPASVRVIEPQPRPRVEKVVVSGDPAQNGGTVRYRLSLRNESHTGTSLDNPVLADLLNSNLEYVVGSSSVSGPVGVPNVTPEHIPNYLGSGETLVRWSWTGANAYNLPAGETIQVTFDVKVRPAAPGGDINNSAALVGWTNPFVDLNIDTRCPQVIADARDLNSNSNLAELICASSSSKFKVNTVVQLDSLLEVRGQLDSDWSRFPEYGRTVPGGTADYRMFIENVGNVSVQDLEVINILPFVGDTGVIDVVSRDTEWRPYLIEPLVVPAGVTVYYSTSGNPCRPEVLTPDPVGCDPPQWSITPPDDITTVRSYKLDFGNFVMGPKDRVAIYWSMRAPVGTPETLIAWDSFGYVATRVDTGTPLLPSEPIKVGIVVEELRPPAYGNYVWLDANNNGLQDAGETGVNGVRVELYTPGTDGVAGNTDDVLIDSTVTANDFYDNPGYYLFSGMPPGDYYARFYPSPIYGITGQDAGVDNQDSDVDPLTGRTIVTTLVPGEVDDTWDLGLVTQTTAAVGNYVWFDRNSNGIQDESPSDGINGVTVSLLDAGNNVIATTSTSNDPSGNPGYYLFDDLTPGTYSIEFVLPGGTTFTTRGPTGAKDATDSDPNTGTGRTEQFTLVAGEFDPTWDAGIILPTNTLTLGNLIWFDTDRDGIRDTGEDGIDGVRVNLYTDTNNNGVYDAGTDTFVSTVTSYTQGGQPGYYSFSNLAPGNYIVVVPASNFVGNQPLRGLGSSPNSPAPDPDNDLDNDDNGEPATGGNVVAQAVTLALNSEPITDGDTNANTNMSVDFGFYQLASIGDYVWFDRDSDGTQNEPATDGINGVTVRLRDGGGTVIATTTTADDDSGNPGYYLFDGLEPGNYSLEFVLPSGATGFTTADQGGNDSLDSDVDAAGVTPSTALSAGEADMTWDAGVIPATGLLQLGNLVWGDTDNDGTVDGGENGIAGVRVNLYRDNGDGIFNPTTDTFYGSTLTDASGNYLFSNLPNDDYFVQVDSTNFASGRPLDGLGNSTGNGVPAPDPNNATDNDDNGDSYNGTSIVSQLIDLTANNLGIDFGFYELATIGDRVWVDSDRDGIQDANEFGLPSVTVRLLDSGGNAIATDVTDANGNYLFEDLVPGTYAVRFDLPPGYVLTTQDAGGDTVDSDADLTTRRTINTTLAIGEDDRTWDAGVYPVVSVGNYVWLDINNNALLDVGENGIPNVVVNLYRDSNGNGSYNAGDQFVGTTTTDASGFYLFDKLPEGDYIVQIAASNFNAGNPLERKASSSGTAPDPDTDINNDDNGAPAANAADGVVSQAVRLLSGFEPTNDGDNDNRSNLTVDFGFYPLMTLGDLVWLDLNNNGIYDAGTESGIPGVDVRLYRDSNNNGVYNGGDTFIAADTTDANGNYLFDNLPPGNYIVRIRSNEFGSGRPLEGLASSTGNGNSNNPTDNAASDPDNNTENDDNGSHTGGVGSDTVSRAITLAYDTEPTADVNGNNVNTTVDFGFYPLLSLGNLVWEDTNNNGVVDAGENGISGVAVRLYRDSNNNGAYDAGDTELANTTTDSNGFYSFGGLHPGNYIVLVRDTNFSAGQPLDGLVNSTGRGNATGSDLSVDPDNDADNDDNGIRPASGNNIYSQAVTLELDNEPATGVDGDGVRGNQTIDFGFYRLLSLGNLVWADNNNNGVVDAGENGIANVVVNLYRDDGSTAGVYDAGDTFISSDTTDANGNYLFTGLEPVSYIVQVEDSNFTSGVLQNMVGSTGLGAVPGPDSPPDPDTDTDNDDNGGAIQSGDGVVSQAVTLTLAGEPAVAVDTDDTYSNLTVDFGFHQLVSVGNLIWRDGNNNGVVDTGEDGIQNVLVNLYVDVNSNGFYDAGDVFVASDTTDANGLYSFDDLPPGDYIVQVADSNFSGGALQDYLSSTGNDPTPDPDDNTNDDDNGQTRTANGVLSQAVTVSIGGEPDTAADGNDTNGNWTVDFGFYRLVSVGNLVWLDANNNGNVDAGEDGIANVVVNLYVDVNGNGSYEPATDTFVISDTTDVNGNYLFDNLEPGDYLVQVEESNFGGPLDKLASSTGTATDPDDDQDDDDNGTPQTGAGVISQAVTLIDGEEPTTDGNGDSSNLTVDFGFYPLMTLGNLVWLDANNNGNVDAGEDGIANVVVNLYRDVNGNGSYEPATDTFVISDTTDVNGNYLFEDLLPGDYIVQVEESNFGGPLDGLVNSTGQGNGAGADTSTDPDDDTDDDDNGQPRTANGVISRAITLTYDSEPTADVHGNNINTTVDFGFYPLMSLGNLVWRDVDNDGVVDASEDAISGVDVNLYRDDGTVPGAYDAGDTLVDSTTTDSDGFYLFENLPPGDYIVQVEESNFTGGVLQDYVSSSGNDPTPDPDDNTDDDDNGQTRTSNGVLSEVIELRLGEEPTADGYGLNNVNLTLDFGFHRPVSLGNLVWLDANNNGVVDAGEDGIANVVVNLYRDVNGNGSYEPATDTFVISDTTDVNGNYLFEDLLPGDYIVQVEESNFGGPLDGLANSTGLGNAAGADTSTDPDDDTDDDDNGQPRTANGVISRAVTLIDDDEPTSEDGDAQSNLTVDFGFYPLLSLGNLVWRDVDNSGDRDAGEPGLANVDVNLYRDDGTVPGAYDAGDTLVDSTTTDANGNYLFEDLPPGDYIVQVEESNFTGGVLLDYVSSSGNDPTPDPDDNTDDDDNGQARTSNGVLSEVIELRLGEEPTADGYGLNNVNQTLDFGFHRLVSLGNLVWRDVNNNGLVDAGEDGIENVVVNLYRDVNGNGSYDAITDTLVLSDTTDANGAYLFEDLLPGDYIVQVEESNFGGPLDGLANSTGSVPGPDNSTDPDDDTDDDDNGQPRTANGVISQAVTLIDDDEPTSEDGDAQSNLTVDFGFYPLLSLGNLVWGDYNNNNSYEPANGEAGINGVVLNLYEDSNNSGVYDAGIDTFLRSTTTVSDTGGVPGYYLFDDLSPGTYIVQVDESNFAIDGVLYGLLNSTGQGNGPGPDLSTGPDDDTDNDDNGLVESGHGIVTEVVTLADGTEPTSEDGDAQSNLTVDFGFYGFMAIGNRIWRDSNNNGLLDGGENGIATVTVTLYLDVNRDGLYDAGDQELDTTTTDSNGFYRFDDLHPGDYIVRVDEDNFGPGGALEGLASSSGNNPTPDPDDNTDDDDNGQERTSNGVLSQSVTLIYGDEPADDGDSDIQTNLTIDFGFYPLMSIGDRVWNDLNNNGIYESALDEIGFNGVVVNLYRDDNNNGVYDIDTDTVISSTITADDSTGRAGFYLFSDLEPGNYIVQIDSASFADGAVLDGFASSTGNGTAPDPDDDTDDDDNGDLSGNNGVLSRAVTLTDMDEPTTDGDGNLGNRTVDFGFYELATIGDRVWLDIDGDGIQDEGETDFADVKVELYNAGGGLVATTQTDATGRYLFIDVVPGDYYVQFTPPAGYYVTPQDAGDDDEADSDISAATARTPITTLDIGEDDMTWDAGFYPAASLGDRVWLDKNGNGVQDEGEPGLAGVTVELYDTAGKRVAATKTDTSGSYIFRDLVPGSYYVQFTPPAGYRITAQNQGDDDTDDSDANPLNGRTATVTLAVNEHNATLDAGLYRPAALGDYVWLDTDRDGIQDTSEEGVAGVGVSLYDSAGELVETTTTDDSGFYEFTNLPPGDYRVVFARPNGYFFTSADQGASDANDSDADTTTGETERVSLSSGENNTTLDAGIYGLVSIGDRVWLDTNTNGIQEEGENGLGGVTVNLYTSDGELVKTTTTSDDGSYRFTDLEPGDYYLEIVPGDYRISPPDQDDDSRDSDANQETGRTPITSLEPGENDMTWDIGLHRAGTVGVELRKEVALARIVPNQEASYTLTVRNTSDSVVLSPVALTDTLPLGLSYIAGSSSLSEPSVDGQVLVWEDITQGAGLEPGQSIEVTFEASVTTQVGTYINRATVDATHPGGVVTDSDEASLAVQDPAVEVSKDIVTPGIVNGVITFTILITNTGPSVLDVVPLFDTFQGPIEYIGGSVPADLVDNANNALGWNDLTESLGDLEPGGVFQLDTVFRLTDEALAEGNIRNTAEVFGARDRFGNRATDQSAAALTTIHPTAIELRSFTAVRRQQGVEVEWVTGAELDTWGFHLLRSADGSRAQAVQVTPELILGQGRSSSGNSYTWLDRDAVAGVPYTYWLQEVETDGTINEYGPVSVKGASTQGASTVFLPLVRR